MKLRATVARLFKPAPAPLASIFHSVCTPLLAARQGCYCTPFLFKTLLK